MSSDSASRANVSSLQMRLLKRLDCLNCSNPQYPTYICFEIPSNLLLKKVGAARLLPALVVSWGIACLTQGFVTNKTGLYINRAFLGFTEAGLLPGLILYSTFFYKPSEIQLRQALYFGGASLAGAFGGLIAAGIDNIQAAGWNPWRWLFIIEGLLTVVVGLICFFLLPNGPEKLRGLTPLEKRVALHRMGRGSGQDYASGEKHAALLSPGQDQFAPIGNADIERETHRLKWSVGWKVATDPFGLMLGVLNFCTAVGVFSTSFFSPTIVRSLGISEKRTTILLLTVPPFIASFLVSVALGWFAGRYRWRGGACFIGITLAIIGYSTAYASSTPAGGYAGLMFVAMGSFSIAPIIFAWSSLGTWGHYKRAITVALMIVFSNSAAIVSVWLDWPEDGSVHHASGFLINLALNIFALFVLTALETYVWYDRREKAAGRRDWKADRVRAQFPGATPEQVREFLGDEAAEFKRDY